MPRANRAGQLTLPEIANYHALVLAALFDLFADPHHPALAQYVGRSLDEVREEALAELEHTSSLSVLACVEAALRVDYDQRVSARGKSPLSRALRGLHEAARKKKTVVRLVDILAAWRAHSGVAKIAISELSTAFQYRHWLAHGRYWPPKFGRIYDYQTVYSIADAFLTAMVEVE